MKPTRITLHPSGIVLFVWRDRYIEHHTMQGIVRMKIRRQEKS